MSRESINEIDTPALLIDLDRVEKNLLQMQQKADRYGVTLRPHIKTHKIPELALKQIQLGAGGITASKVAEAEVMARAGVGDIFIANQIVASQKLKRLLELSRKTNIAVGLDSLAGAHRLSETFSAAGATVDYLIEINSGLNRCGVAPGRETIELVKAIETLPGLKFKGIFTHAGQVYGKTSLAEVRKTSQLESQTMHEIAADLQALGCHAQTVSVGSTPTMKVWEGWSGINEIRPGNYIFNDAIQIALQVAEPEDCALTVLATVVSRPASDRAVIDAGSKVLALDKGGHGIETAKGHGLVLGRKAVIDRLSEEHGIMAVDPAEPLTVGDCIRIIPNHACPVVNLFDSAYGMRNGAVETVFKIAARGMSQ
ncbi:MAG: alanine racemase [Desulfobacterales bacterium]|nr:MAG: alanine racemase [Desulfobacterales bacterium]